MEKNQALVAITSFAYGGRDLVPGDMFHVEQSEHVLILTGTGKARESLPGESKEFVAGPRPRYRTRDMRVEAAAGKITREA